MIALSQAIDSYDRNDQEQARRQLGAARRYDPQSEAAAWLLARLAANSTRFKVLMEQYYSYLNPAFLGVMQQDLLHVSGNTGVFPIVTHVAVERRLAPWVSLRAGLEGSLAVLDREPQAGFGVLAGVSFRSECRGFEADLNLSWRQRPSWVVDGLLYTDLTALANLTWDGLWVSRKPPG